MVNDTFVDEVLMSKMRKFDNLQAGGNRSDKILGCDRLTGTSVEVNFA